MFNPIEFSLEAAIGSLAAMLVLARWFCIDPLVLRITMLGLGAPGNSVDI